MGKYIKKINEQALAPSREKERIKTPAKPGKKSPTKPRRKFPLRRDKPSTEPNPIAAFDDTSAPSREKERIKTPAKPGRKSPAKPRRKFPLRRDKPSTTPKPIATADDVYNRFMDELRASGGTIKFDIQKLKSKYGVSEKEIVKGFDQFIYEASLEDNPGLPDGYRSDVDRRQREESSRLKQEFGENYFNMGRFMGLVGQAQRLQSGNEQQLEELAERAIRELYKSVVEDVDLDIKFSDPSELKDMMSPTPDEEEEEEGTPLEFEEADEELAREIQKRKISKNIIQGEGKNTKLILNMPVIKDGIIEIMGETDGERYVSLLNEITTIAAYFDWDVPLEVQKEMWKSRQGFSGAVDVSWDEPESEEEQEEVQSTAEDILADIESGTDILDVDTEELFDDINPTIKARAVDFSVLIHETVKGIYQLIAAIGIPEDENVSRDVIMNCDTLFDELEDLRYGPYIAADLRDFVNEFSESASIDNLREEFFAKLMTLPAQEFLDLIRDILMGNNSAKTRSQEIIDEISEELSDSIDIVDMYGSEYDDSDDLEDFNAPANMDDSSGDDEENLSQSEIKALIDTALDNGDFTEVERLAKYLKESIESFKNLVSFNNFKQLNESVKAAKQYYLKIAKADLLKKKEDEVDSDPSSIEITPEEEQDLLSDEDFKWVIDLVRNNSAYAVPFIKFAYDQGADRSALNTLFLNLTNQSNKSLLKELPLGNVNAYASLKKKEGENPGYELLGDHITNLIAKKNGMWLVKGLHNRAGIRDANGHIIPGKTPVNQKLLYQNASQELKDELISVASQYKTKGFNTKTYTGSKHGKIAKFTTLEAIISAMQIEIDNAGTPMADQLNEHRREFPGASVVWEGADKFLVVYRSSWSLGKFCGHTQWCNRPNTGEHAVASGGGMSGQFFSYVDTSAGKVQYAMWDYSKPSTDPTSLVGFTIDANGKLTAAADVPNNYKETPRKIGGSGQRLKNVLEYFEVPAGDSQYIIDSLQSESKLMQKIGPVYRALESNIQLGGTAFVELIENARENSIRSSYGSSDSGAISEIASRVIANYISNGLSPQDVKAIRTRIWDTIMKKGLKSKDFVAVFKILFSDSEYMTTSNIDKIIAINNDVVQRSKAMLRLASSPRNADKKRVKAVADKYNKTIEDIINNANSSINNIPQINSTYLTALKSTIGSN